MNENKGGFVGRVRSNPPSRAERRVRANPPNEKDVPAGQARGYCGPTPAGFRSVVKLRRMLQLVGLDLVVIDPELRLLLRQEVGDALHGGDRLVLVGIAARHAPVVK